MLVMAGYRATGFGSCRLFRFLPCGIGPDRRRQSFPSGAELDNIAVMSFFILSGFVISEAGSTFYHNRLLAFLANRFGVLLLFTAITANVFGIFPFLARTGLTGDAGYFFVRFAWAVMVEILFNLTAFGCFCAAALLPNLRTSIYGGAVAGALALHVANDYWCPIFDALTFAPYFGLGVWLCGMLSGSRCWRMPIAICIALHPPVVASSRSMAPGVVPTWRCLSSRRQF